MSSLTTRFNDLSIRSKLLLGYLTAFVLALVAGGLIIYPIVRRAVEANIESELHNTTQGILNMVKTSADASIKNYLRAVAERNKDILQAYYDRYRRGEFDEAEARRRAAAVLLSQHIGTTGYVYCLDSQGIIRVHPVAELRGADLTPYAFIREQLRLREGYLEYEWQNPGEVERKPKALYMTYVEPWDWIISASSYREEFSELINIDSFRDNILSTRFGETGYSYIIDSRGDIVVHPFLSGNMYDATDSHGREFIQEICRDKNGLILYSWRNPGEREYRQKLAVFGYIPEFDWIVISSSYQEEFHEPLRLLRRTTAVLIVVTLAILFVLTLLYSAHIVGNLNTLVRSFQSASAGDFGSRIIPSSRDEFGKLAGCFNDFMATLESYRQEQQRAAEVLRGSEEKYRTLVDNLNVGIVRSRNDAHGQILQANPAAIKMFGFESLAEMQRTGTTTLYRNLEDRDLLTAEVARSGSVQNRELALRRRDGTPIWASVSTSAAYDEAGRIKWLDTVIEDISERKKLEEQLQHAQKMEAIGTLAGGVAHDFNNILTAIIGYGDLLKLQAGDGSAMAAGIDEILAAAGRATDLTRSLLAFSRRQVLHRRPVDLNAIIRGIDRLLNRIIGEDIELTTMLADEQLVVMADSGQIEQVLVNLATNARDAMPGGGTLVVRSERLVLAEARGSLKAGSYAVIAISDSGQGMDTATRQRIFEPFFTTKEIGQGTGLGLSIVYGIVKQHTGDIEGYSEPGKGTTIKITLETIDSPAAGAEPPLLAPPIGGTETVLVAEDDAAIRKLERKILEEFGYTVIEARDGEEAVLRFREHRDRIQLLIFDVVMPRKNGREAYEEIRATGSQVPVIFTSGYTADLIAKRGMLDGGAGFVAKPMAPRVLLATVREVLENRTGQRTGP